jgi:type I restriction enzyme S subunit
MKSGGTPDTSCSDYYGGDIPFVSIEDMTASSRYLESTIKTLTNEGLKHSSAWIVPANSILYSIYATLGLPRINAMPVATNQAILALITDPNKIDRDYLYYWFEFARTSVVSLSSQTTQSNLSATTVKSLSVDHPTKLAEQAKIAGVLSTVDRAIEQTEALIAKQERIKTGLMQDLLTRGIDEHGNLRSEEAHQFKDPPLGRTPVERGVKTLEGWQERLLGELVVIQGGFAFRSSDFEDDGIPIIRMSDLKDGRIDFGGCVRVKASKLKALSSFSLNSGDFLVGMSGSIDNYAIVRDTDLPAYLNQRVGRFRLRDNNLADYGYIVQIARSHPYRLHVGLHAAGAAQVNISPSQIESFRFMLPPKHEQSKIAEILSTVDLAIEQTEALIAKQERIKTALMRDLLTGKVRVTPLLDSTEVMSE